MKAREHQRVGEEDRVVEKGLRDHQGHRDHAASPVLAQQHVRDLAHRWRRAPARHRQADRQWQRPAFRCHFAFDGVEDAASFLFAALRDQPARAFRHVAPYQQYGDGQHCAESEADAPAPHRPEHARVEQYQTEPGTERCTDPETSVDREVDTPPQPRRNEFVDGRVDGRVFAADAQSGDEAAEREEGEVVRERRRQRADRVDHQRDEKQLLAAEPVGQPAKQQGTHDRTGDVDGTRPADLGRGERQRVGTLEHRADRADQRHFESVEHPRDTERHDHAPVPARPRQAVEPRRNIGRAGGRDQLDGPRTICSMCCAKSSIAKGLAIRSMPGSRNSARVVACSA